MHGQSSQLCLLHRSRELLGSIYTSSSTSDRLMRPRAASANAKVKRYLAVVVAFDATQCFKVSANSNAGGAQRSSASGAARSGRVGVGSRRPLTDTHVLWHCTRTYVRAELTREKAPSPVHGERDLSACCACASCRDGGARTRARLS